MQAALTLLLALGAALALAGLVGAADAQDKVAAAPRPTKVLFKNVPGPAKTEARGLRIYNGDVASRTQFPFQAGIYMNYASFCGGSLIHPRWVLTAAHCVDGFNTWTVFLGLSTMLEAKQEGRIVLITKWGVRHEDYDGDTIINDIGVLQLPRAVELNEYIKLSKLAPAGLNYAGRTATVSGFGKVEDDGVSVISPVLKYTSLPIVSTRVCYDFYQQSADKSQICLEAKGTSSCSGDSGGPLTLKDESGSVIQIGLTSFGCSAGCTKGCPVGFTRINIFYDWLSEKTGINFPI